MNDAVALEVNKASLTAIALKKMEPSSGVLKWSLPVELIYGL